jgi:hypothetical protein
MSGLDNSGFETIVSRVAPNICDLALGTRELIREIYPNVVEVPWLNQNVIGYGVGPKKMSEHFCYIAVHRDHINLGFNYGAELPDPGNLLEGPGKLLRHTKIETLEDLKNPRLKLLLEVASRHLPKIAATK